MLVRRGPLPGEAAAAAVPSITTEQTDEKRAVVTPKGFDRVAGADRLETKSVFSEGVSYTSRFGYGNLFGICRIEKRDGVYHFNVPIRFVGGISFGACTPELACEGGGVKDPPPQY